MKTEIEARLLDVDEVEFIKKLENIGAKFVGDWPQIRNCYDFKPVEENRWIRLRTNGNETTLTVKEVGSAKINGTKELEFKVSDFNSTDEFLNMLGFFARTRQENRRIQYVLDGVEIDIDFWPCIPTYVEFEAESEQAIIDVCDKLGINYSKLTTLDNESVYKQKGMNIKTISNLLLEDERKYKIDITV